MIFPTPHPSAEEISDAQIFPCGAPAVAPSASRPQSLPSLLERGCAWAVDGALCGAMFALQRRHRLHSGSRTDLERYIAGCAPLTRGQYFAAPPPENLDCRRNGVSKLRWNSPVETASSENNRCHADLFPSERGWEAPTVLLLHALMSPGDAGYRRWAAAFNRRGWNACFIHLPYHYSRTPAGRFNGELAITADLVRTAEGLRQGVAELRQLMAVLRGWGCREFGLWASSYGAWIGALLASVEQGFRFAALMEPIADIAHAIWTSPAGAALRRELRRCGIGQPLVERHFHLASPMHAAPLCGGERILLCAGDYDRISRLEEVSKLASLWKTADLLRVPQGHYGNRMMPAAWDWLDRTGMIEGDRHGRM